MPAGHTGMFRVTVTREYFLSAQDATQARRMAEQFPDLWEPTTVVATTVEALSDEERV